MNEQQVTSTLPGRVSGTLKKIPEVTATTRPVLKSFLGYQPLEVAGKALKGGCFAL